MIEVIHNDTSNIDLNRLYDLLANILLVVEVEANTDTTDESA